MNRKQRHELVAMVAAEIDYKRFALEVAKESPAIFCKLAKLCLVGWEKEALAAPNMIEAIKICRYATGGSLKDAREWADANYKRPNQ